MANNYGKINYIAYAVMIFILMLLVSYFWGSLLMSFASGYDGALGIILQLMVTVCFAFGTFVVPLLIYKEVFINPLNIFLGLGQILIGIPLVIFIFQGLTLILEVTGLSGDALLISNFMMIFAIIGIGFVIPIFTMMNEETIIPVDITGGEG